MRDVRILIGGTAREWRHITEVVCGEIERIASYLDSGQIQTAAYRDEVQARLYELQAISDRIATEIAKELSSFTG